MPGRSGGRRRAAASPIAVLLALAALGAACAPRASALMPAPVELTILAAASLREPLRDVSVAYEAATGMRLVVVTDASSALRVQVEQGARADVFLSADTDNAAALASAGLTDGSIVEFTGNRLAVIVPADNPGRLGGPADLARPGVAIVAAGDQVPITRYASELVARLAALPGYPPDFATAYAANVVTREDNVRSVLAKIELGEGDAAIVYATDAATADDVTALAIPHGAGVTATYAGAVLSSAADPGAARAFLAWLAGPAGSAILVEHGFVAVP
jgi:molybdate transport system substrate-binding protein